LPPSLCRRRCRRNDSAASLRKLPSSQPRAWELALEKAGTPIDLPPGDVIRVPSVEYPDAHAVVNKVARSGGGMGIGAILFTGKIEGDGNLVIRISKTGPHGMLIKGCGGKNGAKGSMLYGVGIQVAKPEASGKFDGKSVRIEDLSIAEMDPVGLCVKDGASKVRIARCTFNKNKQCGVEAKDDNTHV
jgi:hypothetical protein